MLRSFGTLKALSVPLSRSFRLAPHLSTLPASSFSQLLAIEAATAEHSFSQIVSQLELDPVSKKWVCHMKVSDFRATDKDREGKTKVVQVKGEGETSLEATNEAARKALDAVGVQSQADSDGTSNGDQTNA